MIEWYPSSRMLASMDSHCTVCRAALREGDVDLERQFVSCSTCGSMVTFRRSDAELRTEDGAAKDRLPGSSWSYERQEDLMRLTWRWHSPGVGCLAVPVLCFLLAGLSGAFGWIPLTNGTPQEALMVTLALSLLFGYPLLVVTLNRTFIEASPGTGLQIRHGPLPWFALPRRLKRQDIQQLYGERKTHKNKGRIHYSYALRVQRPDGSTQLLLEAGLTAEEVLFLERTLESWLGIEDRAVPGDFKPEGSA
ncbi:hypothetical protein [Hyalangium sp.]|uniref:hypothetical protein n=1 Tax=Hyalangium sp. TaxID=2028555 RepID=UPI002D2969F3|nr:hypothetical protein [Hyalangium sp.]HYH97758.1 hypothetical protein [Hyalangium sp.]